MERSINDAELIRLVLENDEAALELLIKKYKRVLHYTVNQYKNRYQENYDFHELYQISLISLYRAVLSYKEDMGCSFYTFLQIVIERDILTYYRQLHREKNKLNRMAVSLDQCVKENEGLHLIDMIENNQKEFNPEDYFVQKEWQAFLKKEMEQMSEEEQQIFQLWMEGYRYEEIAEQLQINTRRVGYMISKIKKKLKGSIDYENTL